MRNLDYINEEIEALDFNIDTVVDKLQSGSLSAAGMIAAKTLANVLIKSRDFLKNDTNRGEVLKRKNFIVLNLPYLYFQIPKLY